MQAGEIINDGGVQWRVRDLKSGGGIQIGTIMPFLALSPPAGWLACDTDALVSRATYAELWAWVQVNAPLVTEAEWQTMAAAQTSVGYYSSGDGSTTFRLPRLVDFVRGSDSANGRDVGSWQEDAFQGHRQAPLAPATTFYGVNGGAGRAVSTGSTDGFPATTGDPVTDGINGTPRTADETRPKNIAMLYCVKAFDAVVNEGLIDVTELANEVAGKQNQVLYAQIVDQKAVGTHGGTFTSGAWRTRDLNTIRYNDNNFVSLNDNQIILPAGTYRLTAKCPAHRVGYHVGRLYNITDSEIINTGMLCYAVAVEVGMSISEVNTKFTIAESKTFEIQHACDTTFAGHGFGAGAPATSLSSILDGNIFTVVEIWKEA